MGSMHADIGEIHGLDIRHVAAGECKFSDVIAVDDLALFVPYCSDQLMTANAKTGDVRGFDIRHVATGRDKFEAALAMGYLVVFVPCCSDQLMTFNAKTGEVRGFDIRHIATGDRKFASALAIGDLAIFVPYNSDQLMIFNAKTSEIRGVDVRPVASRKLAEARTSNPMARISLDFAGAVAIGDLAIFVLTAADTLITFNAKSGEIRGIDIGHVATGNHRFSGAVAVGDLAIFAPACSDQLLVFNATTSEIRGLDVRDVAAGYHKFHGAVAVGDLAVFVPWGSDHLVTFNAKTGELRGHDIRHVATGLLKFASAVAIGDVAIFVPCFSGQLMTFHIKTGEVRGLDVRGIANGRCKFWGAVVIDDVAMLAPYNSDHLLTFKVALGEEGKNLQDPEVDTALPLAAEAEGGGVQPLRDRIMDIGADKMPTFSPITGVMKVGRLPVEEAAIATGVEYMDSCGLMAGEAGARLAESDPHGLDKDAAGALHLYTMPSPLYKDMNALLRDQDRKKLKPFFPLLRLLLEAKLKLPPYEGSVFRGIDKNLKGTFSKGDEFYWWSFTSTTKTLDATEDFLGQGKKTLFVMSVKTGREIARYSTFADREEEVLLFPGAKFRVVAVLDFAPDTHMVQLEELLVNAELIQ